MANIRSKYYFPILSAALIFSQATIADSQQPRKQATKKILPSYLVQEACKLTNEMNLAPLQKKIEVLTAALSEQCKIPPTPEDKQAIIDSLRPYLRTLPRAVTFYHWGARGPRFFDYDGNKSFTNLVLGLDETIDLPGKVQNKVKRGTEGPNTLNDDVVSYEFGPVPLRPQQQRDGKTIDIASDYFRGLAGNYFTINKKNWYNGEGLYAATDPISSARWGSGKGGFLLEINVPAGEKYLDLRTPGMGEHVRLPRPSSTDDAWLRIFKLNTACELSGDPNSDNFPNSTDQDQLAQSQFNNTSTLQDMLRKPYIRAQLQDIFRQLGIEFVSAPWVRPTYSACGDRNYDNQRNTDVVFTDPELSTRADFRVLVNQLEPLPSPEKRAAYARTLALMNIADQSDPDDFRKLDFYKKWFQNAWLSALGDKSLPADYVAKPDEFFGCSVDPAFAEERRVEDTVPPHGWR